MARRILFPYVGDSIGGSHISSVTLARSLDAPFEPVMAVHRDGPLLDYLQGSGLQVVRIPDLDMPRLRPYWRQWRSFRKARRLLGEVISDLSISAVHTNDMRMHAAWVFACQGSGVPHVWHQRTPSPSPHTHALSRFSAARIAVSEYALASLPAAMARQTRVIYNPVEVSGIDRPAARQALLDRLGLNDPETALIGWVANFADRKRPEVFVAMARHLRERSPQRPLHFVMVGGTRDPAFDRCRAATADLGLQGHVSFLGSVHPADALIAGLDVFVAPAVDEAFGRTLVEAALHGVPVVAAASGGHGEILRDRETGLLVPPDQPDLFAQAVQSLLDCGDLGSRITMPARIEAHARFSVARHVEEMTQVYRDVMGQAA
ncbi:glycosyltransferase family 4 protein [Salipiger marinus]|uniref:glycosyltransferase family 4 protein n=1 Tax=Salipiger marinus TaxID=555512 RepID=UPI001E564D30|nr:glycosyltransferase family 4 protein [Salipiger manganoxidans]MCD1619503.1 glycosyltransferase family 4 protein [Salipiger manganoxidans]MEB3420337.1 glycosyltransferase family 4 protein [Salipiger manganoxidans]